MQRKPHNIPVIKQIPLHSLLKPIDIHQFKTNIFYRRVLNSSTIAVLIKYIIGDVVAHVKSISSKIRKLNFSDNSYPNSSLYRIRKL